MAYQMRPQPPVYRGASRRPPSMEKIRALLAAEGRRPSESPGARHARWGVTSGRSLLAAPPSPTPVAPPAVPPVAPAQISAPPPGAMGRNAGGMMGPPEPPMGPPEPPSSSPSPYDDPELVKQTVGMSDLDRQLALAEAMRDQEAPGGRYLSNGRMYVASSPLEHGVSAFQRFRGGRQAKKIGEQQVAGRQRIAETLGKY